MKRVLAILLGGVTLVLIIMGWFQSGGAEAHGLQSASTPEQAVRLMLSQIRSHDFDAALRQRQRHQRERGNKIKHEPSFNVLITWIG